MCNLNFIEYLLQILYNLFELIEHKLGSARDDLLKVGLGLKVDQPHLLPPPVLRLLRMGIII